ncbi:unnamed protein product, partial [Didymodactylos carnosus]
IKSELKIQKFYDVIYKLNQLKINVVENITFSVLHFAVYPFTAEDPTLKEYCRLPSLAVVKLLLDYGGQVNVNYIDPSRHSILHLISETKDDENNNIYEIVSIIRLLNEVGCHWDVRNEEDQTPVECAQSDRIRSFMKSQMKVLSSKCTTARLIKISKLNYKPYFSATLHRFIELH